MAEHPLTTLLPNLHEPSLPSIHSLTSTLQTSPSTKQLRALLHELEALQQALSALPDTLGTDEVTRAAMQGMGVADAINRCGEYCERFGADLQKWNARPAGLRSVALHSHSMEIERMEGEELKSGMSPQEKTTLVQERRMRIQAMAEELETRFVGRSDYPDLTREQRQVLAQRAEMQIEIIAGQGA